MVTIEVTSFWLELYTETSENTIPLEWSIPLPLHVEEAGEIIYLHHFMKQSMASSQAVDVGTF